jgi:hypothetical protein
MSMEDCKTIYYIYFLHCYCCSCRWGESMSLNCCHQQAYCSFPGWYMSMETRWNDADRETEQVGGKPVALPLCPPQTPHGLNRTRNRASAVRGRLLPEPWHGPTRGYCSYAYVPSHFLLLLISLWRQFRLLRWEQNWHHLMWGLGFYTVTSCEDVRLLLRSYFIEC